MTSKFDTQLTSNVAPPPPIKKIKLKKKIILKIPVDHLCFCPYRWSWKIEVMVRFLVCAIKENYVRFFVRYCSCDMFI